MKILTVHNTYRERGGEDVNLEEETRLLDLHGHIVVHYGRNNAELKATGAKGALTAVEAVWSPSSHAAMRKILKREKPDIAHFHNTFPLISPSAYYACADAGVPVVQTLHNYRLLCPSGFLLRHGQVCESCLGRVTPWPGVLHACYRGSRSATLATAAMLSVHRALGTWRNKVGLYIALTEFARRKFIEGGLPGEHIVVKPNAFAPRPTRRTTCGDYALFVGRLSDEKGVQLLPTAWQGLQTHIPLRVVGDGPLLQPLGEAILRCGQALRIALMGRRTSDEVAALMAGARFLIVPSIWYETFCRTVVEAYSCGLPVIASRIGALAEILLDGVTGLHFNPGDAADLAAKVEWAWAHPDAMQEMGRAARREYEAKYTDEANYQLLMRIYQQASLGGRA